MIKKLSGQASVKKGTAIETMLDDVTSHLIKGLLNHLTKNNIPHRIEAHAPIYTVEEGTALQIEGIEKACKTLFLTDDKHESFYLVTASLAKAIDLKAVRTQINSRRLTFGNEDELAEQLGLEPGSVTPLGLLIDVDNTIPLYLDAQLQTETIAIPLFSNTKTLWLPCEAMVKLLTDLGHQVEYINI